MADTHHIENIVGHNSVADCPISVRFCVGKQFLTEFFCNETDTHVPQNVFFCFPNGVWASASGGFGIVSDTLV